MPLDFQNMGYEQFCDSCDPLCDNIEYNYESTSAELQSGESLWGDPDPKHHPSGKPNCGVEVIYFVTLRAFWKYCRKRTERRRGRNNSEQTGVTPYRPNMIRVKAME
ncbi:unnamed protein product [Orchesella dallaii]|uniref:Uncharacterized protein n=1 Tax=Orchesella dallaii TaxID=48710 RepID=A0ABP1PT24_9HEXA